MLMYTLFKSMNNGRGILSACLMSLALLLSLGSRAQDKNYTVYANIIYRFTKYVDWPGSKKTGDFVIGIVGDSPLYDDLKSFIVNKTVGNQKIVVSKMSTSANAYPCQLLFITEQESGSVKRIAQLTAGEPILIVSESGGMAHRGACINFTTVEEHLKLEINKSNIDQRNLRVASELLELATIIK
ncbi:hypothetical protein GCM10011511_05450 [Puia dinghuensis]|uniref:YfiR family protein n=2 Tax=Puia dinghuensis TaxID=1792502 RepID=A0A8J2U825_9BACT|nr:hypothetical protein GCM10011511_05450 [Puia dinghuensis]